MRGEAEVACGKSSRTRASLLAVRIAAFVGDTGACSGGPMHLTVAILMGHSDPSTLAKVYQHLAHNPGSHAGAG